MDRVRVVVIGLSFIKTEVHWGHRIHLSTFFPLRIPKESVPAQSHLPMDLPDLRGVEMWPDDAIPISHALHVSPVVPIVCFLIFFVPVAWRFIFYKTTGSDH